MAETTPIPEPPGLPLLGNMAEFRTSPMADITRLADTYGSIYRIYLGAKSMVVISNNEFINEVCDEKRFKKTLNNVLGVVREGVHDGLFTAREDEENWGKAHRILVPAFGPLSIRNMFDEMHDIATQLAMKFARHGPSAPILTSDDFTRLALDTIALCSMDFRFNSFYRDEMHPFVNAMGEFLAECPNRRQRPSFAPNFLYRKANEKFFNDIAIMRQTADEVIQARKDNPTDRKDLLTAMLEGVDPRTGEKLSDENIAFQLITFLIAGHETTSGLLCFTFYQLLRHPNEYRKVQQEVDEIIGRESIKVEHMSKLPVIASVLRETLRLTSTIPAFGVEAYEDTLLAGKHPVNKGEPILCVLAKAHLDPVVYGDDADKFRPDRMLDENFARIQEEFPNSWKPFGNGKRACIGRPFAWQEAILCMAILFQNFNFIMDDPNYQLSIVETLTLKPGNLKIRASLRHGMTPTELEHRLAGRGPQTEEKKSNKTDTTTTSADTGTPLAVYYGSNSGTCEAMAQRLAADAPLHGFRATAVAPLDAANQNMPKDRPVVIITATYEGQPPSNAGIFMSWVESLKGKEMEGVNYAVYGCGHKDWLKTLYKVPKFIDSKLEDLGGERLIEIATTDASERDMFSDFETYEDEVLWPALKEKYGASADENASSTGLSVEITAPRKTVLRQDVEEAVVISERTLTVPDTPVKKHIEIQLPTGMSYKPGDYLAILPFNPKDTVARVFRRFQLSWDATLEITADRPTPLPTEAPISAVDLLSAYVELSQPATKRSIATLAEVTEDKAVIEKLGALAGDDYHEQISSKRVSVLDLLERFPSIALPLGNFLSMLPPMRVRQYSISSSPLADPSKLTLTYSLLDQPSHSGQGRHIGVATSFLASLRAGEKLHVTVRNSTSSFHLPRDAENIPIICIGAGSGLAPFRGFIQERAAILAAGRKVAPALFFFGCRSPETDDLYADEFARWEQFGAVDVRRAYSRASDKSEGAKYVQDRLWHDREEVWKLWDQGAKVYVCGSRDVGKEVEEVCAKIAREVSIEKGNEITMEEAEKWWEKNKNERFATDVFD